MMFSGVYLQLTRPRAHRYAAEVNKNVASQAHQEKQLELMKEKYEAAVAQVQKNLAGTKAALPEIHAKYEALLAKEKVAAEKAAKKTWDAAQRIIKALPPAAPAAPAAEPEEADEDDDWEEVYNSHEDLPGRPKSYNGTNGTFYQTYGGGGGLGGSGGYWVKEGGEVCPLHAVCIAKCNINRL